MMVKLLTTIVMIFSCTFCYAQIYQWTDEYGTPQFSDEAPKHGQYKILNTPTSPTTSSPTINTEQLEREKALQELTQTQQQLEQECLRAKDYLDTIKTAKIYDLNKKGERIYKSEQQRIHEITRVELAIKQNCMP